MVFITASRWASGDSINAAAANEKASTVTASSLRTLAGQKFAASSLFSVSDPNGDPIVTCALKDSTGSGYFMTTVWFRGAIPKLI
jgi:hypothetical protein